MDPLITRPSCRIRPSEATDVEAVVALTEAVAEEGRWIGRQLPLDHELTRSRFLAAVNDPGHLSIVAVDAEPGGAGHAHRVIGQLHLGVAPYGVADLGMLIAADRRGQGVGRALMTAAVAWAQARPDIHKVELQVWPHNEAALGLYRAFGFEQEGYLRRHYRRNNGEIWDAIVMGLPLHDDGPSSSERSLPQ